MMIRAFLLLPLLILMAGCGTMETVGGWFSSKDKNVNPPTPLVDVTTTINVTELWSRNTGKGTDNQYLELTPAVAGQRIYIVDADGRLTAMDASNGRELWDARARARITGGPGLGSDTVLLGTDQGVVIAYAAADGKELWRARVSSEILSPPQRSGNTVVVRTLDGKLFGINAANGNRTWVYDRSVPSLTLRGTSRPVIEDDIVVSGFDGGRLVSLELDSGRVLWETRVAVSQGRSELEQMVDIDSEPVIVDGVIYVVTFQGQLSAVELESGRLLWSREVSSYAGFSVDDNNVYVSDDNSQVHAYDRYSGSQLWTQDKLRFREITGPGDVGDYLVVGDLEGYLHWMNKDDGSFAARNRVSKKRIIAQPVVAGKFVYVYGTDGTLAAYTYR
ncbi:MAG: outer membrane protein assembly factor BamB [Gammaproteobacteria bacterium]